tara:strand:- start:745 stop:954 length:210 start_codon:yes stop_codon:yes gene_type:complete
MWVAGKLLIVQVDGERYEKRRPGDPIPEAVDWTARALKSNKDLGRIVWVDPKTKTKSKRRKRINLKQKV